MMRLLVVFSFVAMSSASTALAGDADTPTERIQSIIEELSEMPRDDRDGDHVVGEEMC